MLPVTRSLGSAEILTTGFGSWLAGEESLAPHPGKTHAIEKITQPRGLHVILALIFLAHRLGVRCAILHVKTDPGRVAGYDREKIPRSARLHDELSFGSFSAGAELQARKYRPPQPSAAAPSSER
jgi:hypothetical protein